MQNKKNKVIRKKKKKLDKSSKISIVMSILAIFVLVGIILGFLLIGYFLKDKPKLNLEDFNPSESTIVLDEYDNQISELGTVIRQNVEYDDLPTSLVDAFVAVEDSRYFEHNGFDIPRFIMAFIKNIRTLSFSQGASTFTMQLVKNTYFVSDDAGTGAAKSIERKVQEIALALELETKSSKKEIFTNYINKLNFGGTNQNIRGVQKAAQYYYGKDVSQLNLPESAMLAGVINAPYLFNPYNYLDYAQDRRDEVLYQMYNHGYITKTEYEWACSTRVEDFLKDSSSNKSDRNGIPYQAYVDAVISEVYQVTGLDPYTTPMIIHTYMNREIQALMDNIQAGEVDGYFEYPDDEFEIASVCMNNKTGEVIGVLGGRNYAAGGSLLLNHATDQYKQPGSSIKPILDYSQAFEVLGWSTSHVLEDRPLAYEGTNIVIENATNTYAGEVTLKYAVAKSLNTPAIYTIRQLQKEKSNDYLINYLESMGFNINHDDFDEQYAIGGKGFQVSCEQLAGAYGALLNGGYYTKPHTLKKIEFLSDKAPVSPTYNSVQTISEQAAFLTTELLKENVQGRYGNLMDIFNDSYTVYAKTGTTSYGSEASYYNIPPINFKDGWVVAGSSEYTVATWIGYEKAQKDKPSHISIPVYNQNIKGKITNLILDKTVDLYGTPSAIQRPSGVTSITHIIGTFPYAATLENMDSEYITSGMIKTDSKYATLVSPKSISISDMTGEPNARLNGSDLYIEWPVYPNEDQLEEASEEYDISLIKSDGTVLLGATGKKLFDYSWVYGPLRYKADLYVGGNKVQSYTSETESLKVNISEYTNNTDIYVDCYYGFEDKDINSNSKRAIVDTSKIVQLNLTGSPSDLQRRLKDDYGISATIENGSSTSDQNQVDTVEKIVITIPGSDPLTFTSNNTPTINTVGASAIIYKYYEADITVRIAESDGRFVANVTNGDNAEIRWFVDGSSSGEGYSIQIPSEYERVKVEVYINGTLKAEDTITHN